MKNNDSNLGVIFRIFDERPRKIKKKRQKNRKKQTSTYKKNLKCSMPLEIKDRTVTLTNQTASVTPIQIVTAFHTLETAIVRISLFSNIIIIIKRIIMKLFA